MPADLDHRNPTVSAPAAARSGPRRFLAGLYRQTLVEPVAEGRLRDLGWPYGLRAAVVAGYVMFGLAGVAVVVSGPVRAHSTLLVAGSSLGMPAPLVWPMVLLLSFGVAVLVAAALHGPWWLKLLGTTFALMMMGTWSLRGPAFGGWWGWTAIAAASMIGLVVLLIIRWRRRFAWWEPVAGWLLVAAAMLAGLAANRYAAQYGTNFNPILLQQTASTLGFLALPAATVAGASVAEVTVRATVSAIHNTQRLAERRWPYVILGVVVVVRLVQSGLQVLRRDPVVDGPAKVAWAAALVAAFALVGWLLVRVGTRRGEPALVAALGDDLGRIGFAVAAALLAITLPIQVGLAAVQVLAALDPGGWAAQQSLAVVSLQSSVVDPSRALIGVVLILLGVRAARRGRVGGALMLGCVGVMLIALARQLVFGSRTPAPIDPDALNLVLSAVVVVIIGVSLLRRTLSAVRASAYAGVLILSALVPYRDFISDPIGALLGFSGAGLVLFGLTWDLLTGSGWGNGDSLRFPRPTRVLLVLTNSVLTMVVLAYAALVRDGSTTIYLEPYAELGDLVFGTALLAAAVISVLAAARRGSPI